MKYDALRHTGAQVAPAEVPRALKAHRLSWLRLPSIMRAAERTAPINGDAYKTDLYTLSGCCSPVGPET
jgi:hypothetical protein